MAKATFAAGCFWGPEETFNAVEGVTDTAVGYIGGHTEHPTYEQVCSGQTGHTEAVEIDFDPAKVSYEELLGVFWQIHDPTTRNRQGPDVGSQYRSAIFAHDADQLSAAETSREDLQAARHDDREIVTEIVEAPTFWRAEDYHQRFMEKRRTRFGFKVA
ncbi:MAG: peptide-methionine (S)-S-oxide reductase MsrA [Rhodospirillaceae bacterium]|jgi:peptide-methionine (S)-S-oxide reductase|nr:peptide-methionine (S)-S-oxide reductase MsrA [Rhodospirillaceae bacterium]MBT6205790.1 peptide-methionine (S)-S-oxide reductase MsrA [Rhodospirillaceae bacterium]MBT6511651.1 peptide-methionine (S)-S-oxide reductase MsrA [Rhodospirillaceae bacterium]